MCCSMAGTMECCGHGAHMRTTQHACGAVCFLSPQQHACLPAVLCAVQLLTASAGVGVKTAATAAVVAALNSFKAALQP